MDGHRPTTFSNDELLELATALRLRLRVERRDDVREATTALLEKVSRLKSEIPAHGVWIITE